MTLPSTARLYAVIADHQCDVTGAVTGVTRPEAARAWLARHGEAMPSRPLNSLSQAALIRRLREPRVCAVTGRRLRAWVLV